MERKVSLYEKLQSLSESDMLPLHMPGHKRSHAIENMSDIYDIDITEIDGFDDLHHPEGILLKMADKAARIYGACKAYLSVGGSSAANQAAIMTLCKTKDRVLVDRGCHKSVYYAIELGQLIPIYMQPEYSELGIGKPITAEMVAEKLDDNPECKAVVITSPTYEGVCADIASISETVHSHGAFLIVDAAHGAHFGFCDRLPDNPIKLGADIVVTSLHKMLPAPTQTALLLIGNKDIDKDRIQHYMSVFQSSSPSYVLMAGIGECLEYIEAYGKDRLEEVGKLIDSFRENLKELNNISVKLQAIGNDIEYDPFKVVIESTNAAWSGKIIYDRLIEKYHIQCEMFTDKYVLALLSMMDTEKTFVRLAEALKELDGDLEKENTAFGREYAATDYTKQAVYSFPKMICTPGEAASQKNRLHALDESIYGKISADYIMAYPPGIPIIVPGEEYTKEILEYITNGLEKGLNIIGIKENNKVLTVE